MIRRPALLHAVTIVPNDPDPPWHRNVRVLDNGRVAVNPEIIVPSVGQFRDLLILKRVDGRLLIDYSQEGDGNLYPVE